MTSKARFVITLALVLAVAGASALLFSLRRGADAMNDGAGDGNRIGGVERSQPRVEAPKADAGGASEGGAIVLDVQTEGDRLGATSVVDVPESAADGRCVVTARVLGPSGEPLDGVACRLGAKRRWAKGITAEALPKFGPDGADGWVGYEVQTDANGRMLFDVPVPTARRHELFVEAGPYLSRFTLLFAKGKRSEAPLTGGVVELADIQLVACGVVSGVVVTEELAVQQDAKVLMKPVAGEGETITHGVESGGAFVIRHVPAGSWMLEARAPRMMDSEPIEVSVASGEDTTELRIELESRPVVHGRVVTLDLEPVAGAAILAEAVKWRNGDADAFAETNDQGEFELRLSSMREFVLTCSHGEFRPAPGKGSIRLSGARDGVTLMMKPLARVHVSAVDTESGETLAEFGVIRLKNAGSTAVSPEFPRRNAPKIKDVPSGHVEVFGRPGRDLVIVAAAGYPIRYADLAGATWVDGETRPSASKVRAIPSGGEAIVQVVRMSKGATLIGRTVVAGDVVAAEVQVTRAPDKDNLFVTLQSRKSIETIQTSDETGTFSFSGLTPGSYSVVAKADGATLGVPAVEVRLGETTDVGDLDLLPSGTIVGQVQVPAEIDPTKLAIEVVDLVRVAKAEVDAEGRFRLEGVPAGLRTIRQTKLWPDIISGGDMEVNVPAGGEVSATMDLTSFGLVRVKLQVELDGAPAKGVEMRLVDEEFWPNRRTIDWTEKFEAYLGKTDADGWLSAYGRARGTRIPVLHIDGWSVIPHPTVRFDMTVGAPIDERIEFTSSAMTVVLPDDTALPENGSLRLRLVSTADPRIRSSVTIGFEDGEIDEASGVTFDEQAGGWHLARLAPGEWHVSASLYAERIAPNRIGQQETTFGAQQGSSAEYGLDVTLTPGANVEVTLQQK